MSSEKRIEEEQVAKQPKEPALAAGQKKPARVLVLSLRPNTPPTNAKVSD